MTASEPSTADSSLQILIADDNPLERNLLQAMLEAQGHHVISACDGAEAIESYQAHRPDIILMDAMMPNINGLDAARKIKQYAQTTEHFIPILFLTGLDKSEDLAHCLAAGGDDFILKPYNDIILNAKIKAFQRMQIMHNTVQSQRNIIAEQHRHTMSEQQSAKVIFDSINHYGNLSTEYIRFHQSPYALFNGDVLMGEMTPSGDHYIFLGDFTGHGLKAAIGAMPVADIFYRMTQENWSMDAILHQINSKLKTILPVEYFCCAAMLTLHRDHKHITLWQGGLPDIYLLRSGNNQPERYISRHLPLGILAPNDFKTNSDRIAMQPKDCLYLWTDGVLELKDANGIMLGDQRLSTFFNQQNPPEQRFDDLLTCIEGYAESVSDDLTVMEIACPKHHHLLSQPSQNLIFHLDVPALRRTNTLIVLIQAIESAIPTLKDQQPIWHAIFSELYNNALDHGVLALSSEHKIHAQGFTDYYQKRQEKLSSLKQGSIAVTLNYHYHKKGHQLSITLKDSGKGFSHVCQKKAAFSSLYGRGLRLLNQLCSELYHNELGNEVTAVFSWT